jgi:uncharacterized membrane protein YeaQ/YmgE (transglycosylase-associated protein family)
VIESLIVWLIIGAIAGWLAGQIVKGYGLGLVGNIVVGIVGAIIAGAATACGKNIAHRPGTNGNAANYVLRVGMHTIALRPQQTSTRPLGPFFRDRGARR